MCDVRHEALLRCERLAVGYAGREIVSSFDLSVAPGEIVTLIGPNGAGKSTILRTLCRQLRPIGGSILLDGKDLARMDPRDMARCMAVLLTDRVDPELMTCSEVVQTGRYPYTGRLGLLSDHDHAVVASALARVHADDLVDAPFAHISDGQRQRILLARALAQQPRVLIMDEPTSYLDVRHKLEMMEILKDLVRNEGIAVVCSLHELDLAQRVSDRIVCVRDGSVDRVGMPEDIFCGDYVRELYGIQLGSFHESFGCVELAPAVGEVSVFVIGGGGSGIDCYRRLQRRGIPFYAGVLHEGDLDYSVARALAAQVVTERDWEPISWDALEEARALMSCCSKVVCCIDRFGSINEANRILWEEAGQAGKAADWHAL